MGACGQNSSLSNFMTSCSTTSPNMTQVSFCDLFIEVHSSWCALMSPLALWHPQTAWTCYLRISPSSSTSLRFELTSYTHPIWLQISANLHALTLHYFNCYQCAHLSAASCTMFRDDEFHFCMIILLMCSPSHYPRLPICSPAQYTYGRHVICVSDGTEFLGTSHIVDFHSGLPISTSYFVFWNAT